MIRDKKLGSLLNDLSSHELKKVQKYPKETHIKGGKKMTVASNLKTTLAGLKSAQASLETFALDTENQQAKQLYQNAAKQAQSLVDSLSPRLQEIEQEEPQYKQQ
jgi:Protein of unknown function (DUF1657)